MPLSPFASAAQHFPPLFSLRSIRELAKTNLHFVLRYYFGIGKKKKKFPQAYSPIVERVLLLKLLSRTRFSRFAFTTAVLTFLEKVSDFSIPGGDGNGGAIGRIGCWGCCDDGSQGRDGAE